MAHWSVLWIRKHESKLPSPVPVSASWVQGLLQQVLQGTLEAASQVGVRGPGSLTRWLLADGKVSSWRPGVTCGCASWSVGEKAELTQAAQPDQGTVLRVTFAVSHWFPWASSIEVSLLEGLKEERLAGSGHWSKRRPLRAPRGDLAVNLFPRLTGLA